MAVKQIQHFLTCSNAEGVIEPHKPIPECRCVDRLERKQIETCLCKAVIHYAIIFITVKVSVLSVPILTNDYRIGFDCKYCVSERPEETMCHLIGHIKSPSIDIVIPGPLGADIAEIPDNLRIGGIELWHFLDTGKCSIASVGLPYEPIIILGILTQLLSIKKERMLP